MLTRFSFAVQHPSLSRREENLQVKRQLFLSLSLSLSFSVASFFLVFSFPFFPVWLCPTFRGPLLLAVRVKRWKKKQNKMEEANGLRAFTCPGDRNTQKKFSFSLSGQKKKGPEQPTKEHVPFYASIDGNVFDEIRLLVPPPPLPPLRLLLLLVLRRCFFFLFCFAFALSAACYVLTRFFSITVNEFSPTNSRRTFFFVDFVSPFFPHIVFSLSLSLSLSLSQSLFYFIFHLTAGPRFH